MPQRVKALTLGDSELNPGQLAPMLDHSVEMVAFAEGVERWRQAHEHLPMGATGRPARR